MKWRSALGLCATLPLVALTAASDEVTSLPGLSEALNFKHYAGYLDVDVSHGRNLFYWFAESQKSPTSDPLVLWLNGGPGCSSLGGMFTENGPFVVQNDSSTIKLSPTSWNLVANMLWIEAPAGVGFSYSDDRSDYNTGDLQTAKDNLQAILRFFQKYPNFAGREFYIAGESYAGHYIPTLTAQILDYNKQAAQKINLQGILVGNGLTDEAMDFNSPMPFFYNHALISPYTYKAADKACEGNFAPCSGYMVSPPCDPACKKYVDQANNELGNINPYDIYADVCLAGTHRVETQEYRMAMANPIFNPRDESGKPARKAYPPCVDVYSGVYLNNPAVKKAIHANASIYWTDCTNQINYNFSHDSMLPLYQRFFAESDVRVLVYSGDADSVLPFLGTETWVMSLDRPITKSWRSWTGTDGQTAGYVIDFDRMQFLTIKGAGHMVPGTKPHHALDFFSRFISDSPF